MSQPPFTDPQSIIAWLRATAPAAEDIVGISLFCTPGAPGDALCLLDVKRSAVAAFTLRFAGQPFGFTSVAIKLALPPDFKCQTRESDRPSRQRCVCRPQ